MDEYNKNIKSRNFLKFWVGYFARLKTYLYQVVLQKLARRRGSIIGVNCYIHPNLLKFANANLSVGSDSVISSYKLDLRGKIEIGNNVIINGDVEILTASHDHNSPYYETTYATVRVDDFAWIATGATLLPGANIGYGGVVGSKSVVRGVVEPMSIVIGNPAILVKKRVHAHTKLITSSLQAMDFNYYRKVR